MMEVLTPLDRAASPPHNIFLTWAQLTAYYAAKVTLKLDLRLAYLADDEMVKLGIDQRHTGGDDYNLSGAWAAAIHAHGSGVDGIFYSSRHHNHLYSIALFDRAQSKVTFVPWGNTLGDNYPPDLWSETARVLKRFQIAVI